MKQREMFMQR